MTTRPSSRVAKPWPYRSWIFDKAPERCSGTLGWDLVALEAGQNAEDYSANADRHARGFLP